MFRHALPLFLIALLLPTCQRDAPTDDEGDDEPVEPHDEFPGLSAAVEIHIDDRGIPHVYGETDDDVAFASGYQMASMRLFQMDLMRRRALGRQAEVLGEAYLDQDIVSRTFDLRRWGTANMERLREEAPDVYNMMVSWLAGVNQRIAEVQAGDAPMPAGFTELGYMPETWELDDEFAIAKLLYLGNSNSLENDLLASILQRNIPDTWNAFRLAQPMFPIAIMPEDEIPAANKPDSKPSTLHMAAPPAPMDPFSQATIAEAVQRLHHAFGHVGAVGSNNWVIDGRHTENGRPIIANDPHQPLQSPSLMYAQHLSSAEGGIDIAGFSFAGTAGVQLGHNEVLHWGATTNFADVMDLWEVRVEGEGVYIGNELVAWDNRTETILVAGGEPVTLTLHDVPDHGVVLPDDLLPLPGIAADGRVLLANWTGFAATAEEQCFMRMSQAQNLDDWEAAVDIMEVSGFNFVAATAEGISYRVNIKVPQRDLSKGALPYLIIDGDDAASYWTSYLPASQLPRSRAEQRGWIATANNDPWGFTFDGDVTNDPFYYGYFYAPGNRAKRLHDELEQLTAAGDITLADIQAMQSDTHSAMSDVLLPVLADAVGQIGSNPDLAEFEGNADIQTLAAELAAWDRRMERDSSAALIWHGWLHNMAWVAVQDDFAFLYTLVFAVDAPFVLKIPGLSLLGQYPEGGGLIQETPEWVAVEGLRRTAEWLTTEFGGVDPGLYRWGDRHGTRFENPYGGAYDGGWTPTDGGEDTINVSSSNFYANQAGDPAERFESKAGAIFRVVTTFAEDGTPEAMVNFPRGNDGEPGSPHWDDTLEDWVEDVYAPFPFRREDVDAVTEQTIVLEPAPAE